MLDDVTLQIPFSARWVSSNVSDFDLNSPDPFSRKFTCSVDLRYLNTVKGAKTVTHENGQAVAEDIYTPWESISSAHSGLAMKVYPEGNQHCSWPYVEIKCSPAKLIMGHNLFGHSDLRKAAKNMLYLLNSKYPFFLGGHEVLEHLGPMLDVENIRVANLDITYSIAVKDKDLQLAFIEHLSSVSKGQTKARGSAYEATAYFGEKRGRLKKIKVYIKHQEMLADNKKRKTKRKPLIPKEVLDQAADLIRFELSLKREWMDRRAIPTNLTKLIDWLEADTERLNKMYTEGMKDLFEALEGAEMNITNEGEIYSKIEAVHGETRGKPAKVFGTYQSIKAIGLNRFREQHTKTTYYRLVNELKMCGFNQAFICNLHNLSSMVVKLPKVIDLTKLHNPEPQNHVYIDLWEQVA